MGVRRMFWVPRASYGSRVRSTYPQSFHEQRDPRRISCAICEHSEFVHGDFEARRCLYSECRCSGFQLRKDSPGTGSGRLPPHTFTLHRRDLVGPE